MRLYDRVFLEVLKTWLRNFRNFVFFGNFSTFCVDFWRLELIKSWRFWEVHSGRFKDFALVNWIIDKSWHVVKIPDQKFSTFVSKSDIFMILEKLRKVGVILSCGWDAEDGWNWWFWVLENLVILEILRSCITQYINCSLCVRNVEIDEIVNFA